MDNLSNTINRVIHTIDWRKIKSVHKKLGIFWEFNEDKDIVRRVPTVAELKDDLRSLLYHMKQENLNYLSYGNWVIFWENEEKNVGDIRVIFRVADFQIEEDLNTLSLDEALKSALEKENYEYAAVIRDKIQKKT
jgi:hypothetical protein